MTSGLERTSAWARSGAMWLTGRPEGPALISDGDPAGVVAEQLATLDPAGNVLPGVGLLGERGALAGLTRQGAVSAGGACHLLPANDAMVAVSLPRPSDLELLPALIEGAVTQPWPDVTRWLARLPAHEAVDRARLLGLAAAVVPPTPALPRRPPVVRTDGGPRRSDHDRPRVLDLSSLWAGPLCAHLLGLLGADVIKVESITRPDGARFGDARFYDLLHAGHRSVALDLASHAGRTQLCRLVSGADVVIEASRPRALRQLGVDAERAVADGRIWVGITAYGRAPDGEHLIGYGDDVAAGGGLVARDADGPVFAGDAIADPLTGVCAAAAATAALTRPVGALLDISMHDIACAAAVRPPPDPSGTHRPDPATARELSGSAAALGAHTDQVLRAGW